MQVNERGFRLPEVRDGVLVRKLKGACLETCFLQLALNKRQLTQPTQPTSYRYKLKEGEKFTERKDADIIQLVWNAVTPTATALAKDGFTVCYAQSTYHRCGKQQTRGQASFSVDLPLLESGKTV